MEQKPVQSQAKDLPIPGYFSALAAKYAEQSGNATYNGFLGTLKDLQSTYPITKDSVVHDNAAGPGTATSALFDTLAADDLPEVLITDNVPNMVKAAADSFASRPNITVRELDSQSLEDIPDDHFTHTILNFSVFTFADPAKGLSEIYRTLKPDGLAAITTWKRFGASAVIRAAQLLVRPDVPPMKVPHPELMQEDVLRQRVVEAGFDASRVQISHRSVVVSGRDLDGLRAFMLGDFTRPARAGWTEEEVARWPDVIEQAVKEEIDAYGGVKFESWAVLARK